MTTQAVTPFLQARRINRSLTASLEQRALHAIAPRLPLWVNSDHLTLLGFLAQLAAGLAYALSRYKPLALLAVIAFLILNWFGDSLDGTLARIRHQQRPRYGFYVDHMVDVLGATALMSGLALSGFVHPAVGIAMLIAFLLLAAESYLATYTLSEFHLSPGLFGPTELRLLLIAGNLAVLRSPFVTVFHHRVLLYDLGGLIGTTGMLVTALILTAQHTRRLYKEEPLA